MNQSHEVEEQCPELAWFATIEANGSRHAIRPVDMAEACGDAGKEGRAIARQVLLDLLVAGRVVPVYRIRGFTATPWQPNLAAIACRFQGSDGKVVDGCDSKNIDVAFQVKPTAVRIAQPVAEPTLMAA